MARLYYWRGASNAGDYFSYWLAKKLYKTVVYDDKFPNLIMTGSILEHNMLSNSVIVFGSGLHCNHENSFCRITNKDNFVAVRGKLTAELLHLPKTVVLGDPGLLASKFYKPKKSPIKKKYCIVCHMKDYNEIKEIFGNTVDIISMRTNDLEPLFDKLNSYEMVFSSSLHGIIFSHSFGIPAMHVELNNIGNEKNFKFKDYFSVLDIDYTKYKISKNLTRNLIELEERFKNKNKYKPDMNTIKEIQQQLLSKVPSENRLHKKYNAVICAIAKNENLYINNWVNYNLKLGFDHIFLFDNNDTTTEYVGNEIERKDKVTIFNINGLHKKNMQLDCYNDFYNAYKKQFNWCAFIDIDEFISGVKDINSFLANNAFNEYEMIRLKWKIFNDNDVIKRDLSVPVQEFFTQETHLPTFKDNGKCIVRGNLENIIVGSCHFAFRGDMPDAGNQKGRSSQLKKVEPLKQCLPSGAPSNSKIKIEEDYSNETVYLNHYMTKTLQEFLIQKLNRGDAVFDNRVLNLDYFYAVNTRTSEKDAYVECFIKMKDEELLQDIIADEHQLQALEKMKIDKTIIIKNKTKPKKQAASNQEYYLYF